MSRVSLEGQVAVVTGAARGVGELLARKLSARGAKVALVGLEPDALKAGLRAAAQRERPLVRRRHRPRGDGPGRARRSRSGSARSTSSSPTPGVATGGPFVDSDPEAWRRVIEVNLIGSAVTARAFLPVLMESRGYLLQIASLAAITPAPMMTAYCASKSGVEAYAHSLRGRGRLPGRAGGRRLPVLDRHRHGARRRPGRRDAGVEAAAAVAVEQDVSAGPGGRPARGRDRAALRRTCTGSGGCAGCRACAATCRRSSGPSGSGRCGGSGTGWTGCARGWSGRAARPTSRRATTRRN